MVYRPGTAAAHAGKGHLPWRKRWKKSVSCNRAKWLLIEQLKMTEAEAHRHIEKQAMDRCTTRREIALGIIKTYA